MNASDSDFLSTNIQNKHNNNVKKQRNIAIESFKPEMMPIKKSNGNKKNFEKNVFSKKLTTLLSKKSK